MESIFFIPCSLANESALYKSVWPLKVPSTKPVWPWKVSSSNRFDHRKGLLQTGLVKESAFFTPIWQWKYMFGFCAIYSICKQKLNIQFGVASDPGVTSFYAEIQIIFGTVSVSILLPLQGKESAFYKPGWPWKVPSLNRFDHRKGLLQTGLAMESGQTGLRNFRSPPGRPQILMKLTFLLLFYTKTERPKIKCFTTAFSLEKLQTFYVTKRKRAKFNYKIFL